MIEQLIEIAFSRFWKSAGVFLSLYTVLYMVTNGILLMWTRFLRMLMVRKHGWPPEHLDADGDWIGNQN